LQTQCAVIAQLRGLHDARPSTKPPRIHSGKRVHVIAAVRERVEVLAHWDLLQEHDARLKAEFADRFPSDIPHVDHLPTDVYHRIELKDNARTFAARSYSCPKKYRGPWKELLDQHLAAGRIRESTSPYVSPAFIVPKADPSVLPCWVNDYRLLNANTVPDRYPMPRVDDILADCLRGKIWGKMDMTNSFFQTLVHPDDIKYTVMMTPFGLYEWVVMPMGLINSPATHQRRMNHALRKHIGSICHVYLDDIIIWSQTVEEHLANVRTVLTALRDADLFVSQKKTQLFTTEVDFLGHHISQRGLEPDPKKVEWIKSWPIPKSSTEVRGFLRLIRYLALFLPHLADHTGVLTPLTTKDCDKVWPGWERVHQGAFDTIKTIVLGADCLTSIDHDNPGARRIFVTCNASDRRIGCCVSFGDNWESARPVGWDSRQLNSAQRNYPTHEKELLAIVHALQKFRSDLLGSRFTVYTDHRTLENFLTQRDLSRRCNETAMRT
jgi:hypothetical protein